MKANLGKQAGRRTYPLPRSRRFYLLVPDELRDAVLTAQERGAPALNRSGALPSRIVLVGHSAGASHAGAPAGSGAGTGLR